MLYKNYIFQYPALVEVMMFECVNKQEECKIKYNFEENAIFVWSKETCVGDEVFHMFFASRGKRETHFSCFVDEMTSSYKDADINSAPFLSVGVFISCTMSWIINQKIDYRARDSICPFCGHNPEVLACDGVSVGVSRKFLTKLKEIEVADKRESKDYLHRRNTRILIKGTANREFLLTYCEHLCKLDKKNNKINFEIQKKNRDPIVNCDLNQNSVLQEVEDQRCKTVLKKLFDQEYALELAKTIAKLLIALNSRASLFNFFPTKDRIWLYETYGKLKDPQLCEKERYYCLKKLKELRPQFASIMKTAIRYHRESDIANFFQYLIERTNEIHQFDTENMPDEPNICEPYDPTRGISYNFTEHGGQIRRIPKYAIEGMLTVTKYICFSRTRLQRYVLNL